jgi:hypothetical protein
MAFNTVLHTISAPRDSVQHSAADLANALAVASLSRALTAGGAAIATTTTKVKTANTLTYSVRGQFYSKAGTDNLWTLAGAVVPANSFQKYALLLDTAGTATAQEATPAATALAVGWNNVSALSRYAALIALCSDTKTVVAMVTVQTDATHTFTPGTTALNAAGITTTYADGVDQSLIPLLADAIGNLLGNGG